MKEYHKPAICFHKLSPFESIASAASCWNALAGRTWHAYLGVPIQEHVLVGPPAAGCPNYQQEAIHGVIHAYLNDWENAHGQWTQVEALRAQIMQQYSNSFTGYSS